MDNFYRVELQERLAKENGLHNDLVRHLRRAVSANGLSPEVVTQEISIALEKLDKAYDDRMQYLEQL